ncbi:MAG: AAA family ATPase [Ignavibacteria bacterium]|nr:AAA family ATPase [Ignavibacteria bacterium]
MVIPFGKMILQKILSVYYPDKFITIGSSNILIDLAEDINLQNIELTANNLIEINYECKKVIDSVPVFQNWSYEKIGSFVWEYFDGENKKGNKKDSQKYYLVGAYWDGGNPAEQSIRFIENGFWENGYDDKFIDDVNAVPIGSKIAIKAAFTREKTKSVMAIKARGTVLENNKDGRTLVVEWEENFIPFEVDFSGGYWATIKEVTNKEHIKAIFYDNSTNPNAFELIRGKFQSSVFNNYINLLHKIISELKIQRNDQRIVYSVRDNSLNFTVGQRYCFNLYVSDSKGRYGVISKTILHENSEPYDGTPPQPYYSYFKDFNPNSFEWESIIDSIKDELDRTSKSSYGKYNNADFENYVFSFKSDKINTQMNFPLNTILYGPPGTGKTYNTILRAAEIVENRKIDSYQEALEIFKANLHNSIEFITFHQNYSYEDFIQGLRPETDNKSSLTFDKRDGIFKKIADKALENLKLSEKAPDELSNKALFLNALEKLKDNVIDSTTPIKINETAYFTDAEDDAFRYSGDNWTLNDKGFNGFRMKYSDLIRFDEENVVGRKDIKELTNISGLAKQHASYFFKAFELVKSMIDIKQMIKSNIEKKNYVIIIDEINRANISRVFGELITLIEPDKRSHGDIPLEAKLPSGDYFIVPSNLYIIGTMNTADKSIALLDIALRRRFVFESMYPLYEIKGSEIFDKGYITQNK